MNEKDYVFTEGVIFADMEKYGTQYILLSPTIPVSLVLFLKEPKQTLDGPIADILGKAGGIGQEIESVLEVGKNLKSFGLGTGKRFNEDDPNNW